MICFYHSADLDGRCGGAIVKHFHPDCDLYGIDYGEDFPWTVLEAHQSAVMVDFSLPAIDMETIHRQLFGEFIWIDHHLGAILAVDKLGIDFKGLRNIYESGCELAWRYFSRDKMPDTVRLLGRYDVWDHSDPDVMPLQYGIRTHKTSPEQNMDFWTQLLSGGHDGRELLDHMLNDGRVVDSFMAFENKRYAKANAFETKLDGLRIIAVNRLMTNSKIFDHVWDPEKYDAMMVFGFAKNKWRVSLYTTLKHVDVSEIARKYGGNGHKGAAGFILDRFESLPFEIERM